MMHRGDTSTPLLEVRDLVKHFQARRSASFLPARHTVRAVDGVSFTVDQGETLGLVGESGSGKSTVGRLMTRLLTPDRGQILLRGNDIAKMSSRALRDSRRDIQLVFQDPYSSLNPRHTVGEIIGTALRVHHLKPKERIVPRTQELLELVGLSADHHTRYPHEFSGGQRQRIGIARALAVQPRLIVADEPVSALDVSIQAQIMNLLEDLRADLGLAFVFISHDMAVVRHFCDRIAVMYMGRVIELGTRDDIYTRPRHPYTQTLLAAVPDIGWLRGQHREQRAGTEARAKRLADAVDPNKAAAVSRTVPGGCRFRNRCHRAEAACVQFEPALTMGADGHWAACHLS